MPTSSPASEHQASLPVRDVLDLARRFRKLSADPPRVARETPFGYAVGDTNAFHVLDLNAPRITSVSATVQQVTDHAYFFVENGVAFSDEALATIASDFESLVYPSVTAAFGKEWTPGVDSDHRITLLHANLRGAGGYFSLSDEYPMAVVPRSNEREMLYLDAGILQAPGVSYNALVGHELQHLIHWSADPSEDSWVNEGLSQVAAEAVGAGGDWVDSFLDKPDTQLTFWPEIGDSAIHYAASELFFSYLLDHYGGRENAKELLAVQGNGIAGVDEYLKAYGKDFVDVFSDWIVANYADAADGPFSHLNSESRIQTFTTVDSAGEGESDVGQFASDYIDVTDPLSGSTFFFDGAEEVGIGVPEHDGAFWWSGRGDGIDTKLTKAFDLRGLQRATLRFDAWYEIEEGWDYGYVAVSVDSGATWTAIPGRETTDYDPVEAAYGPGYTGESGGWVAEEVDLSAYAGRKVLVRFEYVSDDATSFTGLAVDNIELPELQYGDDADGNSDWTPDGFTSVSGRLPQQFVIQLVAGERENPTVSRIDLDAENRVEISLAGPAMIVVSGIVEGTAEPAGYRWELRAP